MQRLDRRRFHRPHNYLLALAAELLSVPLRGVARVATGPRQSPDAWRSGLIIAHSHIGDVLYRTPSLPALAKAFPECRWTFLTSPAGAEALRGNPHVRPLAALRGDSSWSLANGAFASLRRSRFDVALCTNAVGYGRDLLLAVALGAASRVSTTHKGLSGLVTHPVAIPYPAPFPEYFRGIVADLAGAEPTWPLRPRLYGDEQDSQAAEEAFEDLGLGAKPVLACAPCSRQPGGVIPQALFVEVLRHLRDDYEIVFVGGRRDQAALDETAAAAGVPPRTLAGELNLPSLAFFFERCAGLLTQDSGPRHIGNAAGIPVGFFRNLCVDPVETGAYLDTEVDLAPPSQRLAERDVAAVVEALRPTEIAARMADFMVTFAADARSSTIHSDD